MLDALLAAGALDEDSPHGLGGCPEEMAAAVPAPFVRRADEPEVRLVDQGSRLQGVAGGLAGELGGGKAAQLSVDQREQLGGRTLIALADGVEDLCYFAHGPSIRRRRVPIWFLSRRPSCQ